MLYNLTLLLLKYDVLEEHLYTVLAAMLRCTATFGTWDLDPLRKL